MERQAAETPQLDQFGQLRMLGGKPGEGLVERLQAVVGRMTDQVVRFELDAGSSLAARVVSTSGKIRDEAGLSFHRKAGASEGDFSEGALGKADGLIECETFSGNVTFVSR